MWTYDGAVVGRTIGVGAVAGAATAVATLLGIVLSAALFGPDGDADWGEFAATIPRAVLVLAVIGAFIGAIAGLLAGNLLLLLGARRLPPRSSAARLLCAGVCAAVFLIPILVAGFGWGHWFRGPWAWVAAWTVLVAGAVGAATAPYLLKPAEAPR
ncbi:hypothetical protein AB0F81_39160 [Actinoplanes sp. NPDC024001]|uniref:hypothetical protein n=1 Tax=Actinoplanes sp. NPDC024001 TaxID=3154598 RepID=UPI00340D8B2C